MNEYRGVWTLAEVREGRVHPVSYELLAWGRDLADALEVPLSAALLGSDIADQANDLIAAGADQVYVVDSPELASFLPDSYTKTLAALVERHKPEIFIASATSTGRTIMLLTWRGAGGPRLRRD